MTESEILWRLKRIYAAFGEAYGQKPEDVKPSVESLPGGGFVVTVDFTGGRSEEQMENAAASIINGIMGLRDRAKKWMESSGSDKREVDVFVKSTIAAALVHDLANTDKHSELDGPPFSGCKPKILGIRSGIILAYDPASGTYARQGTILSAPFDGRSGQTVGRGTSSNTGTALTGQVVDESGNEVYRIEKLFPDAIYRWERFLESKGLALP